MSLNKYHLIAGILVSIMFFLAVFSMRGDSLTMDELAHLPAGYSYLVKQDMRLNPEHPPLIKDLAAFPLLFIKGITFPENHPSWQKDINGQWTFGNQLLFHHNNPADQMIFWARMSMILILIIFALIFYYLAYRYFGGKTALLALFFFCFSPTLLAHGRLVTTDVGAAFGSFVVIFTFFNFLKFPNRKNFFIAALGLVFAELTKFSNILLFPYLILITFIWWIIRKEKFWLLAKNLILFFLLTFILIWPVYQFHVWHYPPEKQMAETSFILQSFGSRPLANLAVWMADKPILRAYAQYFLGVFMVLQRAVGGNTGYFLGQISAAGWKTYFPIVYLLKEPLAFHLLTLILLLYLAFSLRKPFWIQPCQRLKIWIRSHFLEAMILIYIFIYWAAALKSNLNIGIRHLLPVLPLTYLLVAYGWTKILENKWLYNLKLSLLFLFLAWQVFSVASTYPYFLSYFNELAGGYRNGYIYVVDSNYDWGQGLKRLADWTEKNNVKKIYVDYFGGADAPYYLKDKYRAWWGQRNPKDLKKGDYLAVSASFLQGGIGFPAKGFDQPTGYYRWLLTQDLVARPDPSIFVFKINKN